MKFKTDREILTILGNKLKQARINEELTQQEVSEQIGIDRTTISLIENGRNTSLLNFIKLVRAYDKLEVFLDTLYSPKYNVLEMLKMEKKKRKRVKKSKNRGL